MKEVLVYSRTNTDGHVDREKVPKIEVEVDLAGSHSRLALGTESPLSMLSRRYHTRVVYQSYTSHFSGIGIIPPPLGWYRWYLLVGIAVLSMVGILVGITVQAIFYLGYFLN